MYSVISCKMYRANRKQGTAPEISNIRKGFRDHGGKEYVIQC